MLLPIIRDKSHDPFIIFGGLFSRDLIFEILQEPVVDDKHLVRLADYCEEVKRHCPSEDYLRGKIAELLVDDKATLPKNSQGDVFYSDVVIEVKSKLNELNLDSLQGSINAESSNRKETAEEELFRYLKKYKDKISWGVLTTGRIFRFYHGNADTCYLEFDIFDIVSSQSLSHSKLFLSLLNQSQLRVDLYERTEKVRSVQAEQVLISRVKVFYERAKGSREDLTKGCLFLLMIKYLEDIGVLPINSLEYRGHFLGNRNNVTALNLKKIISDFVNGRWFRGLEQQIINKKDLESISYVLCDSKNEKALLGLLFDEKEEPLSLSDIYIDHLGNIYQTHIHNHAEGAYYTPYSIGKKLSEYLLSLNQTSRMKFAQNPNKVIVDPACGSGQLLRALIPFAHNFYDHSGQYKPKNSMRRDFINRLVGIDKDEESAFICKIGLGLMGAEEGVGLAVPRLVKKEDTFEAFLDSRRNFSEISREDIFAIVTNPPWESLEFNLTQFYRKETGGSLPKKSSLRKAEGARLKELQGLEKEFENWTKANQKKIAAEERRIDQLTKTCEQIGVENPEFFKGKKNLALYFLYIINRLLEDSSGAYIVVLPDRCFVGEDCPIRDRLFGEIEAYMPFQNCGRIFEGVANGTRFGVIFGRKGGNKDYLVADIPIIEGAEPVDFSSRKIMKADLKVGESETTATGVFEKRTLPFFKTAADIDLLTHWTMHRQGLRPWEQGRINLGNRKGPGSDFGKVGKEGSYKYPVVKSSSYKVAGFDKFKGILNVQFGVSVEKVPDRLKEHFRSIKAITSNVKSDGVRKIAVGIAQNCLIEHDYNFNSGVDTSDLWWLQSLTFNHLVNNLSGSYHINTGLLDFLGGLRAKSKTPIGFTEREVLVLKTLGFSESDAVRLICTNLLAEYPDDFIKACYSEIEKNRSEQFRAIPKRDLLVEYQYSLFANKQKVKAVDRHSSIVVSNRVSIAAFVIDRLGNDPSLGRTKLEKCIYLLEATGSVDLMGDYQRKAAGPLDIEALYHKKFGIEAVAKNALIFNSVESKAGNSKRIEYSRGPKFDSAVREAETILGVNKSKAEKLLKILKAASTEQAEIIATVFAAWNDLLQAGAKPNAETIIYEVRNNWAETKERFTPARLKIALNWLREMKLVPTGNGPRTLE